MGERLDNLDVRCRKCEKSYWYDVPLLVMGEREGKRTMVPPDPDDGLYYPSCKCRPVDGYVHELALDDRGERP